MKLSMVNELLCAAWTLNTTFAFSHGYTVVGWVCAVFAVVNFLLGIANA